MTKNLSTLAYLDENHPLIAKEVREASKERKRKSAREYQRKLAEAYKKTQK